MNLLLSLNRNFKGIHCRPNQKKYFTSNAKIERTKHDFNRQSLMHTIGAKLEKVDSGEVTITIERRKDLLNQYGFLHGGLVSTLIDNSIGFAARSLLGTNRDVLTVEYKTNFLTPADGDSFCTEGKIVRSGKTLLVGQANVYSIKNGSRKLCATGLGTYMSVDLME